MARSKVLKSSDKVSESAKAAIVGELVAQCRKVLTANASRDLEAKHKLGKVLNDRLGPPGKRQKYGAKTAKEVANILEMSRSELSRMRQFAEMYPDFAEFQKGSDCTSWSKVKQAMVKPNAKPGAPRVAGAKTPVERLTRRMRDVNTELKREETLHDAADNTAFREELKTLVEAAGRYLQSEPQLS